MHLSSLTKMKKKSSKRGKSGWYDITFAGGLVTGLYSMVPPLMVYIDWLGALTPIARMGAIGGMVFVTACAHLAKRQGKKLFIKNHHEGRSGFTLIELLVVISIIGILAAIIVPSVNSAKKQAYVVRAKAELRAIATALARYELTYGNYPADANRDIPSGLEAYLNTGNWPKAPWPGSVYDWDSWAPGDLAYGPNQQVYQISIRFCPVDQPTQCKFPNEPWAANFDYYSSVYYCISGPCRAHSSQPTTHPAYCMNC